MATLLTLLLVTVKHQVLCACAPVWTLAAPPVLETAHGKASSFFLPFLTGSSEKLGKKKKLAVPKIIVTGPSDEVLMSSNLSDELPETRTIRDTEEYGPFTVHSKPSTVDAYRNHRE